MPLFHTFNRLKKIKNAIQRNESSSNKFEITLKQKETIIAWCEYSANKIQFDKIVKLYDSNSFSTLPDFEILETILFFQDRFEFDLPQEFLLNCIQFIGMENSDENDKWNRLFKNINDEKLFNERIVENIIRACLNFIQQ
jgi:hypothetical protein